jgi:hypothetical protein
VESFQSIEAPEFESVSREFTFIPGLGLPGRVWSSGEPKYISDVVADAKHINSATYSCLFFCS